jgi:hypothetical protein
VEKRLGGVNGFDKSPPPGRIDIFPIPKNKLHGHLVLMGFKVDLLKLPIRERKAQILEWKEARVTGKPSNIGFAASPVTSRNKQEWKIGFECPLLMA